MSTFSTATTLITAALAALILSACQYDIFGVNDDAPVDATFVDAPVENLYYKGDQGSNGYTHNDGTFDARRGETITFILGGPNGARLGTYSVTDADNPVATPANITRNADHPDTALNIARLLQAVDANPANGSPIRIPTNLPHAVKQLDVDQSVADFANDAKNDAQITLPPVKQAYAQMTASLGQLRAGADAVQLVGNTWTANSRSADCSATTTVTYQKHKLRLSGQSIRNGCPPTTIDKSVSYTKAGQAGYGYAQCLASLGITSCSAEALNKQYAVADNGVQFVLYDPDTGVMTLRTWRDGTFGGSVTRLTKDSGGTSNTGHTDDCYVILYDGDRFNDGNPDEDSIKIRGPGEFANLDQLEGANESWTNEADSFKVGDGASATVWEQTDFKGASSQYAGPAKQPSADAEPGSMKIQCQ